MLSSRPAPEVAARQGNILGFESLTGLIAFGGLLLLLAVSPYYLSEFWPASYNFWPQALFLLLGATVCLMLALSPDSKVRFGPTAYLLGAFWLWSLISIATSVYKHDSYLEVARVFGALLVYFAVNALWTPQRAGWVIGAWILGMLIGDFTPLLQFVQNRALGQFGAFSNPNMLATALAMTLPITLVFPLLVRRWKPATGLIAIACLPLGLTALGLLITQSKGGFLAAIVASLVTFVLVMRAKSGEIAVFVRKNRAPFIGGVVLFVLLFGGVAAKTVVPRLMMARGTQDNSTMFRAFVWKATFDMTRAKPLTGFGPGSFPSAYPKYALVSYTRHAHQSWAQIAAESGVPALIFLLGAVAAALGSGWKRLKTADWPFVAAASGAVTALLVHGCFDAGFQTTSIVILLAVALGALTYNDKPHSASNSRLNFFWMGATLLMALAGNQTQKAAGGEDSHDNAEAFFQNGSASSAINKVQEATLADPGAARHWRSLGFWQDADGADGLAALQTAAALQPTNSANWINLAQHAEHHGQPADAENYFDTALETSPVDTSLLLQRAQFRLGIKDGRGYDDLSKIISLWSQPFGLYAPIEQNVNLDFARATLLLAPRLRQQHKEADLKKLVARAQADCTRAESFKAQNDEMQRQIGGPPINPDVDSIVSSLQQLQTALK